MDNRSIIDDISRLYKFAVDYGIIEVALHPLEYADTLIRLGYEPFEPLEKKNAVLPGKSLVLPSIPSYIYYLYMIDGVAGCFRSVVPHVTGVLIYRHLSQSIENRRPFPKELPPDEPRLSDEFTDTNVGHFVRTKCWRLFANVIAIHVTYPFHVIAVRTMARFVSVTKDGARPFLNDSWYAEIGRLGSYQELFSGLKARVVKEIAFVAISSASFLILLKITQLLQLNNPRYADGIEQTVDYLGNNFANFYTSPFRNASDIMIINDTGIPLGDPPFSDHFDGCIDCIQNLRNDKKWKAAPVLGGRPYTGPYEIVDGQLVAKDTKFGPAYSPVNVADIPLFLQAFYKSSQSQGGGSEGAQRRGSLALAGVKALISESVAHSMPARVNVYFSGAPFRL